MVKFVNEVKSQLPVLVATGHLFRSALSGIELWDIYMKGFTKEENPVFRDPKSSSHNCNLCNNFIRRYGNIVAIDSDLNIVTLFDNVTAEDYVGTAKAMSEALKKAAIAEVFFETFEELNELPYEKGIKKNQEVYRLGIAKNVKRYNEKEANEYKRGDEFIVKPDELVTFNHFHLDLPNKFVDSTGKSIEAIMAKFREDKNVFKDTMEFISLDTYKLAVDLFNQDSLLNKDAHLHKVKALIPIKEEYDKIAYEKKDNWAWLQSYGFQYARFKNELVGTFCLKVSQGENLNDACKFFNEKADPANYMKAKAPITEKMKKAAMKGFYDLGFKDEDALRRFANLADINASEIKHINNGNGELKTISIFDKVQGGKGQHTRKQFEGIEEVSVEKFMKDILPGCRSVEVFLENRHAGNMVALTTALHPVEKNLFRWDNPYSWTYCGNLTGKSEIKEAVKKRGGGVDGVLNIRLHFPDTTDDYDLHVQEPGLYRNGQGAHIYYGNVRMKHESTGVLDLDAQGVDGHQSPEKRVENITYTDLRKMPVGAYKVYVVNYDGRGFKNTFFIEIETAEGITKLQLNNMSGLNKMNVADIALNGDGRFEIKVDKNMEVISSETISTELWGLETNKFHQVDMACLSPNYWGENNVGNKHFFFMLKDCKAEGAIRGFHNENLVPELRDHRKVFEVLADTIMIEPSEANQLSGLGFNATVRDEMIVKLSGNFKRVLKVKF